MSDHKKITITFSTTSGDLTAEFSVNQPLLAVKKVAMTKIGLDVSVADSYEVSSDGVALDESKKLSDLNLVDEVVLFIERKEIVKV